VLNSRSRFFGALVCGALVLSACTDDSSADSVDPAPTPTSAATSAAAGEATTTAVSTPGEVPETTTAPPPAEAPDSSVTSSTTGTEGVNDRTPDLPDIAADDAASEVVISAVGGDADPADAASLIVVEMAYRILGRLRRVPDRLALHAVQHPRLDLDGCRRGGVVRLRRSAGGSRYRRKRCGGRRLVCSIAGAHRPRLCHRPLLLGVRARRRSGLLEPSFGSHRPRLGSLRDRRLECQLHFGVGCDHRLGPGRWHRHWSCRGRACGSRQIVGGLRHQGRRTQSVSASGNNGDLHRWCSCLVARSVMMCLKVDRPACTQWGLRRRAKAATHDGGSE